MDKAAAASALNAAVEAPEPFILRPGLAQVVMCDFGPDPADVAAIGVKVGPLSVWPEMIKPRPCVVLSPRPRNKKTSLCVLVPISTKAPNPVESVHFKIQLGKYPFLDPVRQQWVKADLISSVSVHRLSPMLLSGEPKNVFFDIEDMKAVQRAVFCAMGLAAK